AETSGASAKTEQARRPGRAPKGTPTKKRDQPVKRERTTPVKFVRQSIGELRKVVYPTGQQLINYFVVVLVFVLFVIAYVSLLDLGLGWVIFNFFCCFSHNKPKNGNNERPENFSAEEPQQDAETLESPASSASAETQENDFDIDLGSYSASREDDVDINLDFAGAATGERLGDDFTLRFGSL